MPDINLMLGGAETAAADRAADAWRRITAKPTEVQLKRGNTLLDPQTMRVEYSEETREPIGAAGKSSTRVVIVFGIQGHPDLPDTDIQADDRFAWNKQQFKVTDVALTLGEKQARCQVMS